MNLLNSDSAKSLTRRRTHSMPYYLEDDPGELVARYDFVAVVADDYERSATHLSVGGYEDDAVIKLRRRSQHDIVKWNLQQRLQGRPAPLSSYSQMHLGTAHVFVNRWEAKFIWDARYCHTIHNSDFGDLLQVNFEMEKHGFKGISIAQGHQGERTYRDPHRLKRHENPSAGLCFTDARDDYGQSFIDFSVNNFGSKYEMPYYPEVRNWTVYGKKRRGTTRASLSMPEILRLHSEVFGYIGYPGDDLELEDHYDREIRSS